MCEIHIDSQLLFTRGNTYLFRYHNIIFFLVIAIVLSNLYPNYKPSSIGVRENETAIQSVSFVQRAIEGNGDIGISIEVLKET